MTFDPIFFQSKEATEYRFLSNFWLSPFDMDGWKFATVEHYYQWRKTVITAEKDAIYAAATPREAKDLGAKVTMISDWEKVFNDDEKRGDDGLFYKDVVMLDGLHAKFTQNPDLAEKLLATGNRCLVEYAPWGDTYWGVNKNYVGRNMLGTLLMLVRATLGRRAK